MVRKTTVWTFQATNNWNLTWENLDRAKKETEFRLIAEQNNAIKTLLKLE